MNEAAGSAVAKPILELDEVRRVFAQAGERLEVLRGVSLTVQPGEMVALVGPSGSGKSTLLHAAGLLERPDEGEVRIAGEPTGKLNDDRRTGLRRGAIGFVYQYHHLLPEFSALENVVVPQMIAGVKRRKAAARAEALLARVGLTPRAAHRPGRLSGGEQQRVAIARALANAPKLLLADEPTGNLDHHTADDAFAVLQELVRADGVGALIATHNLDLAHRMDRMLRIDDGIVRPG